MPVKCRMIIEQIERLAPSSLAQSWDAVGLQLGSLEQDVHGVLVALDVTDAVIAEAVEHKANLIISHHPFLFKPMGSIRTDLPQGARIRTLLQHDIAVFSAHTNLDTADGGVNDALAAALGLVNIRGLREEGRERLFKLVVYVPESYAEAVRQAVCQAGAGHIGGYSHCTFQTAGAGTFLPLADTKPFIGERGQLAVVQEIRMETIVPAPVVSRVISAMLAVHPYEEPAYDIYSLENPGKATGLGRLGELPAMISLGEFAEKVKVALETPFVRVCGDLERPIFHAAVCGGSGADLIGDAVKACADVLITGDVKYHEAQQAEEAGLAIIDAGHFCTERPAVAALTAYLRGQANQQGWSLPIVGSESEKDVFRIIT